MLLDDCRASKLGSVISFSSRLKFQIRKKNEELCSKGSAVQYIMLYLTPFNTPFNKS